jgi:type IV fimbrial biogenesis protein FimT
MSCAICSTRQQGLTLPELLIGLGVASLLAMAASGFLPHGIQSARMTADVNRFITALHLARSEAIKRQRHLVLCPAVAEDACARRTGWEGGWLLFASDDNRDRETAEPLLDRGPPLGTGISMHSGRRNRIVYQPDGSSGGSNSSFTFCDRRGLARPRVICLSGTGRPRLSKTRCDGRPVACS